MLLLGVYLYFLYKQKTRLTSRSKIILFLIIVTVFAFVTPSQYLQNRVNSSFTEVSSWIDGNQSINAVSVRLNMYKKGINNIENVPFFGYGLRTSNIALFKNDSSSIGLISSRFNHLHNAYLTNYYNGGILLLTALLFIIFAPLRVFIKANIKNRNNPIFISGVFLTLGYACHGMVNILFGDTYMNGFYVLFLSIFLLLTNKSLKVSKK
jgi:O-antigen ligase